MTPQLKHFLTRLGVAVLLWLAVTVTPAGAAEKPILVHYMPWYMAKPHSDVWGWHWTMNHFDPGSTNAAGRQQLASHYTPLIGAYDSADPAVLEYHVLLMKLAGIDGVIADWYGPDDFYDYAAIDQRTRALLEFTRKAGLKFVLCYEDRSIKTRVDAGKLPAVEAVARAQAAVRYAATNYFNDSAYLRFTNGRPVLLNFGLAYFKTAEEWEQILSANGAGERPAFFSQDHRLDCAEGAFNWPPMHLAQKNGGTLTLPALNGFLDSFEQRGHAWPGYISSAFPRFHDIYQQAGLGHTYGQLADADGQTFRDTLTRALTNRSAMVQLVTWNDYGEGTVIEPTVEFGYRDLSIVQELRRRHWDKAFKSTPDDLKLALRLYQLRRQQGSNLAPAAELDRAFGEIVAGNFAAAAARLKALEAKRPPALAAAPDAGTVIPSPLVKSALVSTNLN